MNKDQFSSPLDLRDIRITDDFWDVWELLYNMFERCEKWSIHSGAGHWPDADMLPTGAIDQDRDINSWTKFTEDEQITMMNLWCIFRSPLIIGGELTKNDAFTLDLLTNPDVIAMNKNARHSHQVWRRKIDGTEAVLWTAVCSEGGQYAAVFNIGEEKCDITVPLTDLEIYSPVNGKNLWTKAEKEFDSGISVSLEPHSSAYDRSHSCHMAYFYDADSSFGNSVKVFIFYQINTFYIEYNA